MIMTEMHDNGHIVDVHLSSLDRIDIHVHINRHYMDI